MTNTTRTTAQKAADAKRRGDYDTAKRLYNSASIEADTPSRDAHFRSMWEECDRLDCERSLKERMA